MKLGGSYPCLIRIIGVSSSRPDGSVFIYSCNESIHTYSESVTVYNQSLVIYECHCNAAVVPCTLDEFLPVQSRFRSRKSTDTRYSYANRSRATPLYQICPTFFKNEGPQCESQEIISPNSACKQLVQLERWKQTCQEKPKPLSFSGKNLIIIWIWLGAACVWR